MSLHAWKSLRARADSHAQQGQSQSLPRLKYFVVVVVCSMADFYDILINKIKEDDFYTILGCDELATTDQINAEFRQKAKKLHPDKNPGDESIAKSFERLQNARNNLCDEDKRKKYDYWRRSGIAVPYEQWRELSGAVHTSLHWAAKPRKELMLNYGKAEESGSLLVKREESLDENQNVTKRRKEDDILDNMAEYRKCGWSSRRGGNIHKFRKYEI